MNRKLTASLFLFLLICLWSSSAFALAIGADTVFDVARIVVFAEDGSGGLAAADAIQFNTGFTITAFFGRVACLFRAYMEVWE